MYQLDHAEKPQDETRKIKTGKLEKKKKEGIHKIKLSTNQRLKRTS